MDFGLASLESNASNASTCTFHSSASTLLVPHDDEAAKARIARLESELVLASQECTELQQRVEIRENEIEIKVRRNIRGTTTKGIN